MQQLKRWPLGKLRDAKPASLVGKFPEPMNFEHDGGPRLATILCVLLAAPPRRLAEPELHSRQEICKKLKRWPIG